MTQQRGRLFLLPSPILEEDLHSIPEEVIQVLHTLDYFIVERARTTRRYISRTRPGKSIEDLNIQEIRISDISEFEIKQALAPAMEGKDIGLLSEAGLPAIADPGNIYVAMAHRLDIEVIPMSGPSSIFMALMASGLEGQRFMFHGYLSPRKDELARQLHDLEIRADRDDATQLFMETPYRNHQILEVAQNKLGSNRMFCIAAGIGSKQGFVKTKSMKEWRKSGWPEIHKIPTVFLIR
jgi:16S rRNA (cytidine1402-2'-O)-methyltransferase